MNHNMHDKSAFNSYKTMPGVCAEIRRLMKEKKMKASNLSELIGDTQQHTYRIITGRAPLYLLDAVKIAGALGVTVDELACGKEKE